MNIYKIKFNTNTEIIIYPGITCIEKRKMYIPAESMICALRKAKQILEDEDKIIYIKKVNRLPKRAYVVAEINITPEWVSSKEVKKND